MNLLCRTLALAVLLLTPIVALGQGMIIPPERIHIAGACAVRNVSIDASIREQVAEVQLSQTFHNASGRAMEARYIFPVPPDAVISQFVLMVDGKELPAKLYSREEANRIYEGIVRSKRDPALLEYMGCGALQTQVFPIPAYGERKITLRYTQVCRRDGRVSELLLPLVSGRLSSKPVEELSVTVRLESKQRIKSVYSPNFAVNVERQDDHSAVVRYTQRQSVPADDFRLMWDLSDQAIGASILSYRPGNGEDGYFLLLASPEVKAQRAKAAAKTVVLALDHSGSMAGQKIEQARNALKFVLNNLREGDMFNIVSYDDRVESFKPELQSFSEESRQEALRYIDSIHDGGSTNIDGALKRAFELVGDTRRPSYVIFMTDGLPTAGVTNPAEIAANAKRANHTRARLFAFGVGFDVNARLLDELTTENSGASEYVRPNENIEASVSKFYGKITAPVMTQVKIELAGAEINRVYPRELPDLFAGGQLIAVGRYRNPAPTALRLCGRVGQREEVFEFPARLAGASGDETYAFVEKLWATRRVGEIINELDLHGRNQELIDELVRLSTRHGILTPYTAFLADERTSLTALKENRLRAENNVFDSEDSLARNVTGAAGVNQRMAKASYQYAASAPQQGVQLYKDTAGKEQVASNVQVLGNKAMFRRGNRWIDPTIKPEEDKKAIVVDQFSDRYFELARNNAGLRRYLAMPDGCTVRVEGQVYQINATP